MTSTFEYIDSAYSSSDASKDILNIHIGTDELSYYVSDGQSKIVVQRHFKILNDRYKSISSYLDFPELNGQFAKIRICVEEAFTLIPSDIFRPVDISFHFKNSLGSSLDKELQFDQVKHEGVVLVYGIDKELLSLLENRFTRFDYFNAHTVLLNSYYEESKNKNDRYTFLNFNEDSFSFTVLDSQKLIFGNVFKFKSPEDCLYYILRAAKELDIDFNLQECVLSGQIEYTDRVYKLLNDYLNKIEFIKRPSDLQYSDEHYRRLPSNAFFDLYSMSRCE